MKLLVHACCGPCAIMPTRLLHEAGHDIVVFYANSNITPAGEYEKRLAELRTYAAAQGFDVREGVYDPQAWEQQVAPIGEAIRQFSPAFGEQFAQRLAGAGGPEKTETPGKSTHPSQRHAEVEDSENAETASEADGSDRAGTHVATVAELLDDERRKERCRACYRLRLEEAARAAAEGGFDALTTTLAVSPYQFTDVIHEELQRACAQTGVKALFEDFRPYYDEATRISREIGMYRQNYCGCRFSIKEGEATRAFIKQMRKEKKAQRARERAAEEEQRRQQAAHKQAYAEAQAKKRATLKALRNRTGN